MVKGKEGLIAAMRHGLIAAGTEYFIISIARNLTTTLLPNTVKIQGFTNQNTRPVFDESQTPISDTPCFYTHKPTQRGRVSGALS